MKHMSDVEIGKQGDCEWSCRAGQVIDWIEAKEYIEG